MHSFAASISRRPKARLLMMQSFFEKNLKRGLEGRYPSRRDISRLNRSNRIAAAPAEEDESLWQGEEDELSW